MKQRRALWGWGGVVLGLHALVLMNLPRHATPLVAPAMAHTFSTRTLALPAPETLAVSQRTAASPPAAAPAVRSKTPPARPAPRRTPARAALPAAATGVAAAGTAAEGDAGTPPAPGTAFALNKEALDGSSDALPALSADAAVPAQPLPSALPGDSILVARSGPDARAGADAAAVPPAPAVAPAAVPDAADAPAKPVTPEAAVALAVFAPGAEQAQSGPAPAVKLPAPQKLKFDVSGQAKKFQYSARAELLWQYDGQNYQARQEISLLLLGARTQTSSGTLGPAGLQPKRFSDRARSEKAAHFDYDQHRVTFSANAPDAPMATGTQDRLSVFVQLSALLAAAPERYPVGTRIQLATAGTGSVDSWTFTVEGEETLNLPVGSVHTLRLQRLPRSGHEYDQKAQLWLAPMLGYLPARIRLTQANGDFADLRLLDHSTP